MIQMRSGDKPGKRSGYSKQTYTFLKDPGHNVSQPHHQTTANPLQKESQHPVEGLREAKEKMARTGDGKTWEKEDGQRDSKLGSEEAKGGQLYRT